MKIFTNRKFIQKLFIAIVCVSLVNFCLAPRVEAKVTFGGSLMSAVRDFATALGDVAVTVIQLRTYRKMGLRSWRKRFRKADKNK